LTLLSITETLIERNLNIKMKYIENCKFIISICVDVWMSFNKGKKKKKSLFTIDIIEFNLKKMNHLDD
jgi:hypothetical protein